MLADCGKISDQLWSLLTAYKSLRRHRCSMSNPGVSWIPFPRRCRTARLVNAPDGLTTAMMTVGPPVDRLTPIQVMGTLLVSTMQECREGGKSEIGTMRVTGAAPMTSQATVFSVEALKRFRAALALYADD